MLKKKLMLLVSLIGFLTFGQENNLERIEIEVRLIEADSTLNSTEFDWVALTGIATDGGGILKVWQKEDQIHKVIQEIGFSYGRIKTTIFLRNGLPIKIIEIEENFGHQNDTIDYGQLKEVFRATIYVCDWENDESNIIRLGKRVMSEGECSNFEYEPIITRAEKALSK